MTDPSPDTELMALIDRVGQRDEAALRLLYDRTSPRLFGLALRVVRQREWAEDVLQEAFMTIWRVAGDYRGTLSPPLAWLGLIVRSRALDLLRRRTADRAQLTQEFDEVMAETLESGALNPNNGADKADAVNLLEAHKHPLRQFIFTMLNAIKTYCREVPHCLGEGHCL